jgi:cytochrome c
MRGATLAAGAILLGFAAQGVAAEDLDQRIAAANPKRGQLLFMQCKACHGLAPGEPHKVGPNLNGIFGRTAGTAPGFKYTDATVKSGIVWTPATMDAWLMQPGAVIPGNGMAFPGIASSEDRASVIAYLLSSTGAQ